MNCKDSQYINPNYYSFVVVRNLQERDTIPCKLRQNGMIALVVDEGYAQYQIQTKEGFYRVCDNNAWIQIATGDKIFDGSNLIILKDETYKQEYLQSGLAVKGQMIFFVPEEKYYTYDGIKLEDPFPNKLDRPTQFTDNPDEHYIPVYDNELENPEWLPSGTLGKVESVNNVIPTPGTKNIELSLSDIPDDVGYATDADLTQVSGELDARIIEVEGINYTWNPTNRTLTLFDTSGRQMSQVSLVSLDNEGTDFRYNSINKSLELYNADNQLLDSIPVLDFVGNVGTALQLNSNTLQLKDSQGNILSSVSFSISNISGLQTALDAKESTLLPGTSAQYYRGDKTWQVLNKSAVGLSNVDNTSDINKPVSIAQQTALNLKINKPTTSITALDATWKYLPVLDDDGNSRKIFGTDILKNIGNTDLTLTSTRNFTQGSYTYTHATGGQLYNITGLPDKSTDASFNSMLVQNATGQIAKSNGKEIFKALPSLLTQGEKDAWGTAWNGQYSNGALNVYSITPVVYKNNDEVKYLVLQGLNLNLNPASTNIKFIPKINSLGVGEVDVLGFTPSANGQSLVVTVNGTTLPLGEYNIVIRTTSPIVQTHRTMSSFIVVDTLTEVNVNSLVWQELNYGGIDSQAVLATGRNLSMQPDSNIKPLASDSIIMSVLKSSEIFPANSNFYLVIDATAENSFYGGNLNIGICDATSSLSLINPNIVNQQSYTGGYNSYGGIRIDGSSLTYVSDSSVITSKIILIRKGDSLTVITISGADTLVKTITFNTNAISVSASQTNCVNASRKLTAVISSAYTF